MASLNTTGQALGRVSGDTVNLRLCSLNGYTRTFASDGYLRVNPFQVENGAAPDPGAGAPYSLNAWDGYSHTTLNSGSLLAITAEGYGEISLSWTQPAGYSRDTANLVQRVYWKDMGLSQDLSVDPLVSPTGSADAGDGTTYIVSGLTAGHWYALAVVAEWNDSVTTHDSIGYNTAGGETPLLGATRGISSGEVFATTPSIDSITQSPLPAVCYASSDTPDFTINITTAGPSTLRADVSTNGGSTWSVYDSAITAGASSFTDLAQAVGTTYTYRLRYNDIGSGSPGPWSATAALQAQCDLI